MILFMVDLPILLMGLPNRPKSDDCKSFTQCEIMKHRDSYSDMPFSEASFERGENLGK
jgi:hypothetical protein